MEKDNGAGGDLHELGGQDWIGLSWYLNLALKDQKLTRLSVSKRVGQEKRVEEEK